MVLGLLEFPKNKCFWENLYVFGSFLTFLGTFLGKRKVVNMQKKNYKGRCEKRSLSKCKDVCRTYNPIQRAYSDILENDNSIKEFQCNVPLENSEYTSDFLCTKTDGDLIVRECVQRKLLTKPRTVKLLDVSKEYWLKRGIEDWRIVIDDEE